MPKDTENENYSKRNEIVTVKFHTDANETLTQAFDLDADVGSLRSHLHRSLNVDPNRIVVERQGQTLRDGQTLKALGATSLGIFELDVRGDGGVRLPKPAAYRLPVVDVITVNVKYKQLVVEIERCSANKQWLGGYRDRISGRTYHHAVAQTDFRPKAYAGAVQADKRSQTCADKGTGGPGPRTACTQTSAAAAAAGGHRWLLARRYRSYQTWLREDYVVASVLKIQRAYRKMVARKKERSRAEAQAEDHRRQWVATRKDSSMTASIGTGTTTALESKQQHFCSLYTMIGKWWKKERQRIKGIEAEHSRRAAQMNLLNREIKFLLEVEKQRQELKYELTKHDDMTFLNKTSKPRLFKNKTGKLLTVDTVGNQKARALRDVYVNITAAAGADRAGVLDRLYAMVAESAYKYKKNLLDAIAMERDLAAMQADARSVQSVRSRVEQLFRHFIRQPEVNPEADSYYRPSEKRILNVYTCIRCKRNLAATDFSLESRVNRTNVCANCEWTEQVGHKRIDMAPYRRLLKAIRHDEMQAAAYESECFLMQPTEVYRLVSIVWNERSAIAESAGGAGQLNGLRLVRWRRNEPWSPWNCVLLTRSEAAAHCRLDGDPAHCYDALFVQRVTSRHMMARLQFGNLVQAVKNRRAGKAKTLSKNWKIVADNFKIKTS